MEVAKIALGPALAAIGLIVGYYYFSVGRRRKRILFDSNVSRLIASKVDSAHGKINVTYNEYRVLSHTLSISR